MTPWSIQEPQNLHWITVNFIGRGGNESFYLKLLQTFAGVLYKKNSYARCFWGNPHKLYIIRKVISVKFDKIMFCFGFCFPKAAEAVNSKMIDWRSSELIGSEINCVHSCKITAQCTCLSQSLDLQNRVSVFFYFYWLSFHRSVKFDHRKIRVTCCVKDHHQENI